MKFTFTKTKKVNIEVWSKSNAKLEQDLRKLTVEVISEDIVNKYLENMCSVLKPVDNDNCKEMLFLMYDAPDSMPADARVEYVYKPTYIAATIMMTAMNRYESVAQNSGFKKILSAVLEATTGRNFYGAGYEEYVGFMDTLQIFAAGDTMEFIGKYPTINEHFISKLEEALDFLENEICSGKIKDAWSGDDYSDRGKKIFAMYQKLNSAEQEYVWYACYGSNVNRNRFMNYINQCSDNTPPLEDRPYYFEYPIYFAKTASGWQDGGKAFLDDSRGGSTYGRMYKIKKKQFEEVKHKEGPDYTKKIELGEIDGIPVYTFTDIQKNEPTRTPSDEYFTTILSGLKECYNGIFSDEAMTVYLINAIFPKDTFYVVRVIKESEHYISNEQICEHTGMDENTVNAATKWLVEHNVIQQDQRSIRAGHEIDDPKAFFFTTDSHCGRKLVSVMTDIMRSFESETAESGFSGEVEGRRHYVISSRIERSGQNRLEAIRLHGYKCQVCGFDFEKTYGTLGRNYIEVHHINTLAEQAGDQIVNPETDLICLCANCHRMVHRNRNQVLAINELKDIISI